MSNLTDPNLILHRGKATWGEELVPLDTFRQAAARSGKELSGSARDLAIRRFLENDRPGADPAGLARHPSETEGPFSRIALFGGVYSNHLALEALIEDAAGRGAQALYCLGDLGAFGPSPEKVRPLLDQGAVRCIQGNYEQSLSSGREDCNCGYTDPRDNYFAELSYRYTAENCSRDFKRWMGDLPMSRRLRVGDQNVLLVHGSPRRVNEFLFESTTPVPFLEVLLDQHHCDALFCTHTGLHWHRRLPSGRNVVNVGVIGRPANDGRTNVWYCLAEDRGGDLGVELLPLRYDYQSLAREMHREQLPEEFIETVSTGWWTTCLEILPARERQRSRV